MVHVKPDPHARPERFLSERSRVKGRRAEKSLEEKGGKNTAFVAILQEDPQRGPLHKPKDDARPAVVRLLPGARRGQACLMMQPSCQLIYK